MRWGLISEMTMGDQDVSSFSRVLSGVPVWIVIKRKKLNMVSINNSCKEFSVWMNERNAVVALKV